MSARTIAACALWALALHVFLWHAWVAPASIAPPLLVATLASAPLVPILVLHRRRPRQGLLWGATLGLAYLAHGVMEVWANPAERWLALGECAWVLLLLAALGHATRVERRARLAPAGPKPLT